MIAPLCWSRAQRRALLCPGRESAHHYLPFPSDRIVGLSNHHISTHPPNALIRPSIVHDRLVVSCKDHSQFGSYQCDLEPDTTDLSDIEVLMHQSKSTPRAYDMGPAAETWFTQACGVQTKFVYLPRDAHRPVLGNIAASYSASNDGITFQDCAQYLIATQASLREVQKMVGASEERPFDIKPLRPNIVVASGRDQLKPWAEDFWSGLQVCEEVRFEVTANCARCNSIDVKWVIRSSWSGNRPRSCILPSDSYETGARDYKEYKTYPLKELSRTRRIDPGMSELTLIPRALSAALLTLWQSTVRCLGDMRSVGMSVSGPWLRRRYREASTHMYRHCVFTGRILKVGNEVKVTKRNADRTVFQWPGMASDLIICCSSSPS